MKISDLSKKKKSIITNTESSSMTIDVQNEGQIDVNTSDIVYNIQYINPSFEVKKEDQVIFNIEKNKNQTMNVTVEAGAIGPPGPPGKDGDGSGASFISPVKFSVDSFEELGNAIIGTEPILEGDLALVHNQKRIYVKEGNFWINTGMDLENKVISVTKGKNGGKIYAVQEGQLLLVKESERTDWKIMR